ncbi:unnamed protein product, partial [Brassica rapa]
MEEMTRQEGGLIAIISHSQVLIAVLPRRPSPFSSLPLSLFFSLHYPSLILLIVMSPHLHGLHCSLSSMGPHRHFLSISPHHRDHPHRAGPLLSPSSSWPHPHAHSSPMPSSSLLIAVASSPKF